MNNPYPEFTDERNKKHFFWQEGWDAREVVTKELYEACRDALKFFIEAYPYNKEEQKDKLAKALAHYEAEQ